MKYEFGSPDWIAFTHGAICQMIDARKEQIGDASWSMCEVFTNPPPHLSPDGAPIAWHYFVRNGQVEFGVGDREDVDYRVSVDYNAVLPVARFDTRGDPARAAELGALTQTLIADGLLSIAGNPSNRDSDTPNAHDVIARVTK